MNVWRSPNENPFLNLCKVKCLIQPNPCDTTTLAWSVSIPELQVEKGINEEENAAGELLMLTCFGCSCLLQHICIFPLVSPLPPILFPGNKEKEFCCGQVWNLSGSSPVVSIREKAVVKGGRALGSLGGEMAAGAGDDRSKGLPAPLEQVSQEEMLQRSSSAAGRAERGGWICKRAASLMECMCCAKCPQIPVVMQQPVTIKSRSCFLLWDHSYPASKQESPALW